MPVYEYRCQDCGATFEVLVRAGADVTCPHRGSVFWDKLLSAPFVPRGQTARGAGHTCCGQKERCAALFRRRCVWARKDKIMRGGE